MNKYVNRKSKIGGDGERDDDGFTLVEILIAIVLIGILSAVVVVGISSLTEKGNNAACTASADAAKAGAVVYFANAHEYPDTLSKMTNPYNGGAAGTTPAPAVLTLPTGVVVGENPLKTAGAGWTLTMTPGTGGAPPTFACSGS